jgi:transcriptional regulator with XRE-family HTH domain
MSTKKPKKKPNINKKIRSFRERLGISARKIADEAGVSLQTAQRYESSRSPSYDYLFTLIQDFGGRANYFFDEDDDVMLKSDEKTDPEIVHFVKDVATEVEYLKSKVEGLLERESKREMK